MYKLLKNIKHPDNRYTHESCLTYFGFGLCANRTAQHSVLYGIGMFPGAYYGDAMRKLYYFNSAQYACAIIIIIMIVMRIITI